MWKKIGFDPIDKSVAKWNYIVFMAGVSSFFLDFVFLYIPTVDSPSSIGMDWESGAYIAIARSVADLIFLSGIIFKFHNTNAPRRFNVLERKERNEIVSKYSKSSFLFDLVSILPVPQVFVGHKIVAPGSLCLIVFSQLPFKTLAMSPHFERTTQMTGILTKNAWFGALQNLLFFIVMSNGMGAIYYDTYISTLVQCSLTVEKKEPDAASLDWDQLIARCTQKYKFEYGAFSDAFATKIGTRSFIQKYTFCLSWGLKSLSSFGQIFNASSYTVDTLLTFFAVVFGLILFGDLLARMQTGLQCTEVKEDRQRTRQRMVEEWMDYHQLPRNLKNHVKQVIQSEWSTTRGINDKAILDSLPWDIRRDIRKHLYLETVRTMPVFAEMDDHLVDALCGHLRTFSSNAGTYVVFEDEPVQQLLFIFSGELEVSYANNGRHGVALGPGDLCGRELLQWCSLPTTSTANLRPSCQTVKCLTDVDAFSLPADDVKLLAIQFYRDGEFRRAFQRYAA